MFAHYVIWLICGSFLFALKLAFFTSPFRSQFSTVQLFRSLMHPNPVPGPRKKLRKCTSFGTLPFAVWLVPYRGPIAIPGVSLCSQASIREPCRLVCHPGWLGHGRALQRRGGTTFAHLQHISSDRPWNRLHLGELCIFHRIIVFPFVVLSFGRELSVAKTWVGELFYDQRLLPCNVTGYLCLCEDCGEKTVV